VKNRFAAGLMVGIEGVERAPPTHRSSADRGKAAGSSSLISIPLFPYFLNSKGRGQQAAGGALGAERRALRTLSLIFQQRGLRVEHVDVRRAAGHEHEEEDDVLGLGRKNRDLRRAVSRRHAPRGGRECPERVVDSLIESLDLENRRWSGRD